MSSRLRWPNLRPRSNITLRPRDPYPLHCGPRLAAPPIVKHTRRLPPRRQPLRHRLYYLAPRWLRPRPLDRRLPSLPVLRLRLPSLVRRPAGHRSLLETCPSTGLGRCFRDRASRCRRECLPKQKMNPDQRKRAHPVKQLPARRPRHSLVPQGRECRRHRRASRYRPELRSRTLSPALRKLRKRPGHSSSAPILPANRPHVRLCRRVPIWLPVLRNRKPLQVRLLRLLRGPECPHGLRRARSPASRSIAAPFVPDSQSCVDPVVRVVPALLPVPRVIRIAVHGPGLCIPHPRCAQAVV
jgi:hypothetical protein